jgi:hypothetical protein
MMCICVRVQVDAAAGRDKSLLEAKAGKVKAKLDDALGKATAIEVAPMPKIEVRSCKPASSDPYVSFSATLCVRMSANDGNTNTIAADVSSNAVTDACVGFKMLPQREGASGILIVTHRSSVDLCGGQVQV